MLVCNPYEVVIHGTTSSGKIFRPSDWAERLCGILSSFTKDNRLSYSKWVRPMLVDNIRCVAVDKKLETDNPQMFRFLMDFAADNDLRVIDCKALLEEREQGGQNDPTDERVLLAQAIEEKHAAEKAQEQTVSGASYVLREIGADDTATAFAALSVLRSALTDINRFTEQINKVQRPQGYRLLGILKKANTTPSPSAASAKPAPSPAAATSTSMTSLPCRKAAAKATPRAFWKKSAKSARKQG